MKKFLAGICALALVLSLSTGALATEVQPYCPIVENCPLP